MSSAVLSPLPPTKAKKTSKAAPPRKTRPAPAPVAAPVSIPAPLPVFETLAPTENGRKRWTREEMEELENSGFLTGRYELLDGEIISKMGQNAPHSAAVMCVIAYLLAIFGRTRLRTQTTMEVKGKDKKGNRPEPDVFVLREPLKRVAKGTDVLLIVEVSDTTLNDDLDRKKTLYARAGVAEYWVLDVTKRRLFVFRNPSGETWDEPIELMPKDSVSCLAAPDNLIKVSELLD